MSLDGDWPLFGLRVETPRLTLVYPADSDLDVLNALASRGIHDPGTMPFAIPWTDDLPDVRPRNSLQFWWGLRATWKTAKWTLNMMVKQGDQVVGIQAINATDFAVTRVVESGSWLGRAHQGHGIGKEMRAAILHLAFVGLGAERAASGAFENNAASLAVSKALGYVENGDDILLRRGEPARLIRLVLHRRDWEKNRRDDIQIHGLEPCLPMFGIEKKSG